MGFSPQNPCSREGEMYREISPELPKIDDFYLPFGDHLDEKNRLVILSK